MKTEHLLLLGGAALLLYTQRDKIFGSNSAGWVADVNKLLAGEGQGIFSTPAGSAVLPNTIATMALGGDAGALSIVQAQGNVSQAIQNDYANNNLTPYVQPSGDNTNAGSFAPITASVQAWESAMGII